MYDSELPLPDDVELESAIDSEDGPRWDALPDPDDTGRDLEGIPWVCYFCQQDGPLWVFEITDPDGKGTGIHLCEEHALHVIHTLGLPTAEEEGT